MGKQSTKLRINLTLRTEVTTTTIKVTTISNQAMMLKPIQVTIPITMLNITTSSNSILKGKLNHQKRLKLQQIRAILRLKQSHQLMLRARLLNNLALMETKLQLIKSNGTSTTSNMGNILLISRLIISSTMELTLNSNTNQIQEFILNRYRDSQVLEMARRLLHKLINNLLNDSNR